MRRRQAPIFRWFCLVCRIKTSHACRCCKSGVALNQSRGPMDYLLPDWMLNLLPITSSVGLLATLCGICAFFFMLEKRTGWRLFQYLPPLIFIYLAPVLLSNSGILPTSSPVYTSLKQLILPMMLILLLLKVNVGGAIRVLGRGVGVMLFGTLGVVLGAPIGFLAVKSWLGPDGWKAFGVLAGSWIGGTGNMAAVGEMIDADGADIGLAVIGDSTVYVIWLPILLSSKKMASWFASFTGVDHDRVSRMEAAAAAEHTATKPPSTADLLALLFIADRGYVAGRNTGAHPARVGTVPQCEHLEDPADHLFRNRSVTNVAEQDPGKP